MSAPVTSADVDLDAWRSRLGRRGVWCTTDFLSTTDAVELARTIERLGYGAMWLPETRGRDPFAHIGHLVASTDTLCFATGIANMHHRHPSAMVQGASTLAEASGGRFLNAIGVSHAPSVEGALGLDYSKPLAAMRRYLEAMRATSYTARAPDERAPVLVGALGPKMIELAGELADGIHPYWTTPAHTEGARRTLGPDKLICVEQKVVLTDDYATFRSTATKVLRIYLGLPNYRNTWRRLGFSDAEIDGLHDRFINAVVAWGDGDALSSRIDEHLDAGADHVCIQALTPDHPLRTDEGALRVLAPSATQADHPTTEGRPNDDHA